MLEFTRSELTQLAVHYTGNKGNGEEVSYSGSPFKFKEDFVKDTLLHYFLTPFKNDIYYCFAKSDAIKINDVHAYVSEIFADTSLFFEHSKKIAAHLYQQTNHPKIKGGEFYLVYLKDCVTDGELCDAIGIFKSENKETYLKVYQHIDEFEIESENGININKLDKGCLIFNTEKAQGYKISIVDNSAKIAEAALYWTEDFLNIKLREDNFYHTQHFITACKGFCEEVLSEENNVAKTDQMMMMNRSMNFFKERDKVNVKDFEKEVMVQPELIDAFRDYRSNYIEENHLNAPEEFQVSSTAVKKNEKYMRSVLKLDKNFHVYVHGRHDYIQKGYDEDMGMKFYKLYFNSEE